MGQAKVFFQGRGLGTYPTLYSHILAHKPAEPFIYPVNLTDVIPVRFHYIIQLSGTHMLLKKENKERMIKTNTHPKTSRQKKKKIESSFLDRNKF